MPDSKAISVRIPSQLLDSLDAIAEKDYRAKSDGKPNRSQVMLDALEAYIEQRQNGNTPSDDVDTAISKEELENALDSERKDMEQIMYIEIRKTIKPALDKIYRRLEALESARKQQPLERQSKGNPSSIQRQADTTSVSVREHLDVVEDFVLTTTELAKRLGVGRATLYDHRKKGDLPEWTFGKDRDGISWGFDESRQKFTPFINKCDK